MQLTPFHVAVQVRDIDEARDFYGSKMGLAEGRSSDNWIGSQISVIARYQNSPSSGVSRSAFFS